MWLQNVIASRKSLGFVAGGVVVVVFALAFSSYSRSSSIDKPSAAPPLSPQIASVLSHDEVLAKFRERASAAEIQDLERLAAKNDFASQDRATEMVLFKLTAAELSRVGITQTGRDGNFNWFLATSTAFADGGKAFESALDRVAVKPNGVMDLGRVGWYVRRDQFFIAHRALLGAGLRTNEITIVQPQFRLNPIRQP